VSVFIARCPEHGLHGDRQDCFECGGSVEQVEMVEAATLTRYEEALLRILRICEPGGDEVIEGLAEIVVATIEGAESPSLIAGEPAALDKEKK
jgi:hypothetical protein